ncbi:MAG: glutathione S-transferase family protein [Pseudomonadota bacterium]
MTYELAIGDRTYSSWSLRGWLLFSAFDIPVKTRTARMYTDAFPALLEDFAPSRLVPAVKRDGAVIWDSVAIAEELNAEHPDAGMWPADRDARAMARSMMGEMHSGFLALRDACTMNLEYSYSNFEPSDAVLEDVKRIEQLWALARETFGAGGPWLFGTYSIADVFFAPVATRFATYGLPRSDLADAYITAHLAQLHFRQWRAMGRAQNYRQPVYQLDFEKADWPGPTPITAKPIDAAQSAENEICPYSGGSLTDFLEIEGRVFGFCNPFCRDKTVADPEAWPAFMALFDSKSGS